MRNEILGWALGITLGVFIYNAGVFVHEQREIDHRNLLVERCVQAYANSDQSHIPLRGMVPEFFRVRDVVCPNAVRAAGEYWATVVPFHVERPDPDAAAP